MLGGAVCIIDFLIRAFLLYHKYRNTQLINFKQLFRTQF